MIECLMDNTTGYIFAAGFGTRLAPITDTTPKPLVLVHGKPIIEYIFDFYIKLGLHNIVLNTHYLREQFRKYLPEYKHIQIAISEEEKILGHARGLLKALPYIKTEFILAMNGDTIMDVPSAQIEQMKRLLETDPECDVVIGTYVSSNVNPMIIDSNNHLVGLNKRMYLATETADNKTNADACGIYLIRTSSLQNVKDSDEFLGFYGDDDFFERIIKSGKTICTYAIQGLVRYEVTTPADLELLNKSELTLTY